MLRFKVRTTPILETSANRKTHSPIMSNKTALDSRFCKTSTIILTAEIRTWIIPGSKSLYHRTNAWTQTKITINLIDINRFPLRDKTIAGRLLASQSERDTIEPNRICINFGKVFRAKQICWIFSFCNSRIKCSTSKNWKETLFRNLSILKMI